ncbi:4Fe-4S binding protein [Herbaspirillum sp. ST 5-3]|uniref:DUF362 domain-containing protein n=1 Tax=Oxalobacteraceae TaxID=75682 RepID=UPI00145618E3|nr:4Fe-4S binding protein [Herbaspirillum sp. ST 5-3]
MNSTDTSFANPVPERYRPFEGEARLLFWRDACVSARSAPDACRRCEEICPAAALSVRNDGPEMLAACLGCGRCAASCPTGALAVKGFNNAKLPNGNAVLHVECWKVPRALHRSDTISVPCLGGITLPQLLGWAAAAADRKILFVEHDWCSACSAGGVRHPGNAVLQQANRMLEACGRPPATLPAWASHPIPLKLMPREIPPPVAAEAIGRRAFFRRFVHEVAASMPAPPAAPAPIKPLRRKLSCPMPAQEEVHALLVQLAAHYGHASPDALRPVLKISEGCQHHGVCSGVCPTGAIAMYDEADEIGIEFDPDICIACGLCARSCPESAITIDAQGGSSGIQRLTRYTSVVCTNCHREYVGDENSKLCPACTKQRTQVRNLFGTFNA